MIDYPDGNVGENGKQTEHGTVIKQKPKGRISINPYGIGALHGQDIAHVPDGKSVAAIERRQAGECGRQETAFKLLRAQGEMRPHSIPDSVPVQPKMNARKEKRPMGKAHVQGSHGKTVHKARKGENGFGNQNGAANRAHEHRQEQTVGHKPERAGRRIRTAHDGRIPFAVDGGMGNKQKKEQYPCNLVNGIAGVTIRHEKQKKQQHGAVQRQPKDLIRAHGCPLPWRSGRHADAPQPVCNIVRHPSGMGVPGVVAFQNCSLRAQRPDVARTVGKTVAAVRTEGDNVFSGEVVRLKESPADHRHGVPPDGISEEYDGI